MRILTAIFLSLATFSSQAQIIIDGLFEDWNESSNNSICFEDIDLDQTPDVLNILSFCVTNSQEYLYFKVEFNQELDLTELLGDGDLKLYLDIDNDASTGYSATSNVGSEFGIDFGNREIYNDLNFPNFTTESLYFLDIIPLPTITSSVFEFMISVEEFGEAFNTSLNPTIGIYFDEEQFGDTAPNAGQPFAYNFSTSPNNVPPISPISLEKESDAHIRLAAYNLHHDLIGSSSSAAITNVLNAITADIYSFSEVSEISENEMQTYLTNNVESLNWHVAKTNDVICASKFPILQSWSVTSKIGASLIDLPDDQYPFFLLSLYAHPPCCGNDAGRQYEFDAFASFINDAKSPGGVITLEEGTPIVFAGDMNLVGLSQQYFTIINGDIVDESTWGTSSMPDWDGSPLEDAICRLNEFPSAHTWQKPQVTPPVGEFPSGRLDFIFYTGSAINVAKSFTISTMRMSPDLLAENSLVSSDTFIASDHLPVIADFSFAPTLVLTGCTYEAALNYNPDALDDDGSCEFECDTQEAYDQGYTDGFNFYQSTLQCPGDLNEDGAVTTADLLAFLTLFGTVCD